MLCNVGLQRDSLYEKVTKNLIDCWKVFKMVCIRLMAQKNGFTQVFGQKSIKLLPLTA